MASKEELVSLLQDLDYDLEKLPALESYFEVHFQEDYFLDLYLAILRHYRFHPDRTNKTILRKILMLALSKLPQTDFRACSFLIPEAIQDSEEIAPVLELANLLETCSFESFWAKIGEFAELTAQIPHFFDLIRAFMVSVVGMTYQAIEFALLGRLLCLDDAALRAWLAAPGQAEWTLAMEDGTETVRPPSIASNQVKIKPSQALFDLDQMRSFFNAVTPAIQAQ
eukprot:gnl/Trimastix_PCT/534.p1 GENE.gnl/Trimastix_PCT/534~~gnl/Trimastix_PCT/534.p1  ORF type:complete len:225 (+),score=67.16 gnl/Trimastix_PCT/534:40-714(+)